MRRQPDVSVIIPSKNEEKNIERLLKSVEKQDYKGNIEIIVVDNSSTDKTVDLVKPYTQKIIISGPERSSQRNIGAKKAKGDYLLFLDADMELTKMAIRECVKIANKDTIVAINEEAKGASFWAKALALEKSCYQKEIGFIHSARFFPKYAFLKVGGYDENLVAGEDWDITQRFIKVGFTLKMTQKSFVLHHEPDLSLAQMLKKEIYYLKNIKNYAQKNPKVFRYQQNPIYRMLIYLKSWKLIFHHPVLTMGFIFYKALVFVIWKLIRKFQ